MDANFKKCLDSLNENDVEIRSDAVRILSGLCDDILKSPHDNKHRRIRVDDPRISEKLLTAYGAIECLFEMGFTEDGEYFSLSPETPLSRLRQIQKALHDMKPKTQAQEKTHPGGSRTKIHRKKKFLDRIIDDSRQALKYENPQLQSKARSVVPLAKLQIGAMERLRQLQREIKSSGDSQREQQITAEDFLLVELLDWFKNDFFTWIDSPKCGVCNKSCKYERSELSTDSRISRTEIHKCEDCGVEAKFPRYTDPGILLRTKSGRCGEWANAFTLICRSLGFDARVVHDETDHVWTEVWSIASNRWIHADPCENAIDRPLIYEKGWKKKLTYVIAYSKDEIQDVTWRYTRDQRAVMKRRMLCNEADLSSLIYRLTMELQNSPGYSEARKRFVTKRRALELVEFITAPPGAKKPDDDVDDQYEGRTSGSLAWRTSRGETRGNSVSAHIWKIPREVKKFELRYYSARNEYEARTEMGEVFSKRTAWESGVERVDGGIFRKIERDWKMCYLARAPGQTSGKIIWSFEIVDSDSTIESLVFRATCATFQSGKIEWKIVGHYGEPEKPEVTVVVDNWENFETDRLNGTKRLNFVVELVDGDGDNAWQHAQIFRQNLDNREECSMSISFNISKNTKI